MSATRAFTVYRERDACTQPFCNSGCGKPRQGVVANTLNLFCNGAVGFIGWLDVGNSGSVANLENLRVSLTDDDVKSATDNES